jgi:hypothetical protein
MGTRGSIAILRNHMFAILRGANGRRHEVDFNEDPVIVDVSIGATAATRCRAPFPCILGRDSRERLREKFGPWLVGRNDFRTAQRQFCGAIIG